VSKKKEPPKAARPKDRRKLLLSILALIITTGILAQDTTAVNPRPRNARRDKMNNAMRMEEEGDLIFNKHSIFGIRLATDGYGISYEKGKFKTPSRTLLYEFELNEKHDPKEHHISATSDGINFSSVVPYKLNNLYEFKMAIGQQYLIGGKGNKNGVAVTALYAGGVTVGLLKPYYLDIENQITGATSEKTYAQMAVDTVQGDYITGAAGFFSGWDALQIKPAVNAKQAMRFDYGRMNQTITAIEVGLTEEYYFSKIPLVYEVPQHTFFFNAYVSILFGSRK
jgi:hypothetical protein